MSITTIEKFPEFSSRCNMRAGCAAKCDKAYCPRIKHPAAKPKQTWADNTSEGYAAYLAEHDAALAAILADTAWIEKMELWHPRKDIRLTLQKAADTFWRTENGWARKRKSKGKKIDWLRTYTNSLADYRNNVPRKREKRVI